MHSELGYDVTKEILEKWMFNVTSGVHDLGYCTYPDLYSDRESDQLASAADKTHLGDMRFLVAIFSLLNYPRIIRERVEPPRRVRSVRWGKPLPRNEVKVIEVSLPKRNGVTLYQRLFTGHGTPKRQHWRRRHPRRILDRQTGKLKYIKWIEPMQVGNPELGVIEHEYFLKAKNSEHTERKGYRDE
jgi:hypothetical protein